MFAGLLMATLPILNFKEPGQAYQIAAQIDCEVGPSKVDLNGAASTTSFGSGRKKVSFLFTTLWPLEKDSKIGLLELEVSGNETILSELDYTTNYVPRSLNGRPPPPLSFGGGTVFYTLSPRAERNKWRWDYERKQVLVHGSLQSEKGTCELKRGAA